MSDTISVRRTLPKTNATVLAARVMRGVEKLDIAVARRCLRTTLFGSLILLIASAVIAASVSQIHIPARSRTRRESVTPAREPVPFDQSMPVVSLMVVTAGMATAGAARLRSLTLSQAVDEVMQSGWDATARQSDGIEDAAGGIVMIVILAIATCGGWYVWEGIALARSRHRCKGVDPARLAYLMLTLHEHPIGVGTKLVFKPREPEVQVRQLVAFMLLHDLARFDAERMWLTQRGNSLMARAAA